MHLFTVLEGTVPRSGYLNLDAHFHSQYDSFKLSQMSFLSYISIPPGMQNSRHVALGNIGGEQIQAPSKTHGVVLRESHAGMHRHTGE